VVKAPEVLAGVMRRWLEQCHGEMGLRTWYLGDRSSQLRVQE